MGVGALSPALQLPLFALGAASHRILLLVPRPALRRVIAAHRPRLGVRRALNLGGRLRPTVVDRRRDLLRLPTDLWLAVPGCGLQSLVSLRRLGRLATPFGLGWALRGRPLRRWIDLLAQT